MLPVTYHSTSAAWPVDPVPAGQLPGDRLASTARLPGDRLGSDSGYLGPAGTGSTGHAAPVLW